MQELPKNSGPVPPKPASTPGIAVWARDLAISLLVSAFIIIFLYQPVKVEGTSMEPELNDQERIFINKFVYRLGDIERGDIVVFHYPRDPSKSYIKRVIALPGDTVRIASGHVYGNDRLMNETYVPARYADQKLLSGDDGAAALVFYDGRSSQQFQRQPGFRPSGPTVHLRQSSVRLLAHG